MTRVHVLALGLLGLACTATQSPPDAKPDTKPDEKPRMCTEMACRNSATIVTKLTAAGAPLGKHEFVLEVDGVAMTCTAELTDVAQIAYGSCSAPDASVWIGPVTRGIDTPVELDGKPAAVVMHTEEPIPGQFQWQLELFGTPAKAHVVHKHGESVLLDQTAEFGTYGEHRPNGEGCEPVCKVANLEWKGP